MCYGWDATSEYRFKIGDFAPRWAGWPKISDRRGRSPPTVLLFRKLGKWSFAWCKNLDRLFFRFVTRVWQIDRILIARPRLHSMQRRKKPVVWGQVLCSEKTEIASWLHLFQWTYVWWVLGTCCRPHRRSTLRLLSTALTPSRTATIRWNTIKHRRLRRTPTSTSK